MHLKDIYLENFKSFGRKLHIPFMPGYTAITGPNGSGKSNIADAILFVLGPKSSKALRVGKLTDLIFDGGKDKKPATFCRVVLTFDNKDRTIPVDEDEVRLCRVVRLASHRTERKHTEGGDGAQGQGGSAGPGYYSYFYVNERASSLNEFDSLLAHARISADGYNLVQQGDINRIVLMSNLERRRILDDIAGITQYDEDIKKAEEKRAATEENLGTIETLLDEVKRQVSQLQRERDSALKYRELRDKRDELKVQILFRRKQDVEEEMASLNGQIQDLQKEQAEIGRQVEELQKRIASAKSEVEALENRIAEAGGADAQELRRKIDELRLEVMRAKDASETARERIRQLKEASAVTAEDLKALEKEIEAGKAEAARLSSELEELREREKATAGELKEAQDAVARSDTRAMKLQRELILRRKEFDEKEQERGRLLLEKERAEDRVNRLAQDIAQLEESIKKYEFQLSDIDFDLKNLRAEVRNSSGSKRDIQSEYQAAKEEEAKLLRTGAELEMKVRELRRRWEQLKAEAAAAASVQKGYNAAVEAILDARDRGELKGIHGTVAELASVKPEHETALTVAAGGRMQSIVVDDDEAAARAINYLKQKKIGRAIFLPLNKMILGRPGGKALMAVKDPSSLGYAMDLVKFKEQYRAAFWFVFGDTIVVKDLEALRRLMGGVRLVTLEGELAEPSGAMVGGTPEQALVKFGAPSESELRRVGQELKEAVEASDKVSQRLQKLREALTQMERELAEAHSRQSEVEMKAAALEFRRKECAGTRDQLKKEREAKLKEMDEAKRGVERVQQRLGEVEAALEALTKQRDEMTKSLATATPQQLAAKIKKLQETLLKLGNDIRDREAALQTSAAKLQLLAQRKEELKRAAAATAAEIKECEASIVRSKEVAAKAGDQLNVLMEAEQKTSRELREWQARRDQAYKLKTDLETQLEKLNGRLETHGDLIISLRSKLRLLEDRHAEIMAEIGEKELKVKGKLLPLAELEGAVKELEAGMQALEPVNMLALEEYEKQAKRCADLSAELEQLRSQRENLLKLVEELNSKKKYGLSKVFNAINKNFGEIYKELSGGGSAELILENPENPFEGGLIIRAQPKDKKAQRLESLSGGEKSLTALSLIFAIQQYQPSPFYLLDEVDMFLDAVNAENVALMIKKNSKMAQFVQITLRKVTLANADYRYGVTMQGNGISDIIGNIKVADVGEDGSIRMAEEGGSGRPLAPPGGGSELTGSGRMGD
ncbi:MAG: chromosome segregation protein SMC [Thermoplasmata archaeon]